MNPTMTKIPSEANNRGQTEALFHWADRSVRSLRYLADLDLAVNEAPLADHDLDVVVAIRQRISGEPSSKFSFSMSNRKAKRPGTRRRLVTTPESCRARS